MRRNGYDHNIGTTIIDVPIPTNLPNIVCLTPVSDANSKINY